MFYFFLLSLLNLTACTQKNAETAYLKKPNFSQAALYNVQLGLAYLQQGDRTRAKKKLFSALVQDPKSFEVHQALAYYFEQSQEIAAAEKHYLKAIALASSLGGPFNNYGAFLCRQGRYSQAEQNFLKAALKIEYAHTAAAYENAGLCALSYKDKKKAKLYLSKALAQDPLRKVAFEALLDLQRSHEKKVIFLKKHQSIFWKDKRLLLLAKDIARQAGHNELVVVYDQQIKKVEHTVYEYNNAA